MARQRWLCLVPADVPTLEEFHLREGFHQYPESGTDRAVEGDLAVGAASVSLRQAPEGASSMLLSWGRWAQKNLQAASD